VVRDAPLRGAPHHEENKKPHPEEPAEGGRLEGWFETRRCAALLTMRITSAMKI
jgi:hypothetical protein